MANNVDLSGRNAVVTGGAQGIGRAIVERFLDSGAAVAIWDRDGALAEKTAGELRNRGTAIAVACDVHSSPRSSARATQRSRASAASTSWSTTPASPAPM